MAASLAARGSAHLSPLARKLPSPRPRPRGGGAVSARLVPPVWVGCIAAATGNFCPRRTLTDAEVKHRLLQLEVHLRELRAHVDSEQADNELRLDDLEPRLAKLEVKVSNIVIASRHPDAGRQGPRFPLRPRPACRHHHNRRRADTPPPRGLAERTRSSERWGGLDDHLLSGHLPDPSR